jgi:hypothetical protein
MRVHKSMCPGVIAWNGLTSNDTCHSYSANFKMVCRKFWTPSHYRKRHEVGWQKIYDHSFSHFLSLRDGWQKRKKKLHWGEVGWQNN